MTAVLTYALLVAALGIISLALGRARILDTYLAPLGIALSSAAMLFYLIACFPGPGADASARVFAWQLPLASFTVGLDSLSAIFLVPLLILAVACALYGPDYLGTHRRPSHWLWVALLVAAMAMVLIARNALLFLLAWELMSLASFLLVITDERDPEAIHAGWVYFVTTHIGTAFLIVAFLTASSAGANLDFVSWTQASYTPRQAGIIFVSALLGFGLKAGLFPLHVWLPLAHPAAPSHVSALMSGIMIKMGIYGLMRILTYIRPYQTWWGIVLIGAGVLSGALGVLYALGQHDIKRLLAYHSVENIGIILLGMGLGVVGSAAGLPLVSLFGFAGAILHVVNHSLFKGLLFLGAGAVIRQSGTGEIDRLGGLIKRMPVTAVFFLAGSIAICGLPFFNGFVSELLVYAGCLHGALHAGSPVIPMAGLVTGATLALIGGLAAACFAKVFGVVFMGEPRTPAAENPTEVPMLMRAGMAVLAACCLGIGVLAPLVAPFVATPAARLAGIAGAPEIATMQSLVTSVGIFLIALIPVGAAIALVRVLLLRRAPVSEAPTWDCGYTRVRPSMQYTASSFASPIIDLFGRALGARTVAVTDSEPLPTARWSVHSSVDDWPLSRVYVPIVRGADRLLSTLRWFQSGKGGLYVFYIALTVFCLVLWKFFL